MSRREGDRFPLSFENFSIFLFHLFLQRNFLQLYTPMLLEIRIKLLTSFFSLVKGMRRRVIKEREEDVACRESVALRWIGIKRYIYTEAE